MFVEMNRRYWLYILLFILMPVLLSLALHLTISSWFPPIAGTESDWVGFWGNYLGAGLTGFISFVVLWKTIDSNILINNTKRLDDYYYQFRRDLSTRLSRLNPVRFVGLIFDEEDSPSEAVVRLEDYNRVILEDVNSFVILYDEDCDEFIESYKQVVDIFVAKIREFIVLYKRIERDPNNSVKKQETLRELNAKRKELSELQQPIESLWLQAKNLIRELKPKKL